MAVSENNTVDGIAFDKGTLIMEIYDHLDFEGDFEFDHLMILQEKINAYLGFIENKQYTEIYPKNNFNKFLIKIHFLHELTNNCIKYIDNANKQLYKANIEILTFLSKNENLQ